MLDQLYNNELLLLLSVNDHEIFFTRLQRLCDERALQNEMNQLSATEVIRLGSVINKGLFLGSIPVEILWMMVSLGIVSSGPLLVGLMFFSLSASGILAWYSINVTSEAKLVKEQELIKKLCWTNTRNEIITILNRRVTQELDREVSAWNENKTSYNPQHDNSTFRKNLSNYLRSKDKRKLISTVDLASIAPAYEKQKKEPTHHFPVLTCAVISTLLGSLFWGSTQIFGALGMATTAAAMISPIGIGVAVLFAAGTGIFLGYQRYRYLHYINNLQKKISDLEKNYAKVHVEYGKSTYFLKELSSLRKKTPEPVYSEVKEFFTPHGTRRMMQCQVDSPMPLCSPQRNGH